MTDDDDRLDAALDAWTPLPPAADFAERVLEARDAAPGPRLAGDHIAPRPSPPLPRRPPRRRQRVARVAALLAATAAAAATVIALVRPAHRAVTGTVMTTRRITQALGDRGLAVAEPGTELTWQIDPDGDAELVQRTGNAFYRVERGGPFVVHTPAGDVRVTGTCFRIEVSAMSPNHKLLVAGAVGAALATAVLVTVYEGHVIAETRSARAELAAGASATLHGDDASIAQGNAAPPLVPGGLGDPAGVFDEAHASRDQLIARARQQQAQLIALRSQLASAERTADTAGGGDRPEPGRLWHDPSPEKLAAWVAECRVRSDEPSLERFEPLTGASEPHHVEADDVAGYNTAMTEMATQWKTLVRRLYLEVTGDPTGAESLSIEAMRREIEDKSPPELHGQVLQMLARERAGLDHAPTDVAQRPPLEQLVRAYAALGDQSEAALAKRLGADRARAIRGDGWSTRNESAGCPR